jgi:hypothetical protein
LQIAVGRSRLMLSVGTDPHSKRLVRSHPASNDGAISTHEPPSRDDRRDTAVEVALAEFNALRGEMLNHMNAQATLMGIGLTALGFVFGFAIRDGGDRQLLLTVPLLATFVSLLHAGRYYQISVIASYIRERLWPYLQRQIGEELPSWEMHIAMHRGDRRNFMLSHLIDTPAIALFVAASVFALLLVPEDSDPVLRHTGWALTLLSVLCVALVIRVKQRFDRLQAHEEAVPASANVDRQTGEAVEARAVQ